MVKTCRAISQGKFFARSENPHVDRQDPKLPEDLQKPVTGGERQGDDQKIDLFSAAESFEIGEGAQIIIAPQIGGRARPDPVVEHAENLQRAFARFLQPPHGSQRPRAAADDQCAAGEPPFPRPAPGHLREQGASDHASGQAGGKPAKSPGPKERELRFFHCRHDAGRVPQGQSRRESDEKIETLARKVAGSADRIRPQPMQDANPDDGHGANAAYRKKPVRLGWAGDGESGAEAARREIQKIEQQQAADNDGL